MFDFARKKNSYHTIEGDKVDLRRPGIHAQTEWCALRTLSKEHLTPWEPAWNELSASARGFRKRIEYIDACWADRSAFHYFIYEKEQQALVGAITLHNIRYGACMSGQVGYWIGVPYVQKGYMKEALDIVLDHAFYALALNSVSAACMPANKPSIKLLMGKNFVVEGLAREYLCINGTWQDHVIFSLLAREHMAKTS